jgi:hypothetical protein
MDADGHSQDGGAGLHLEIDVLRRSVREASAEQIGSKTDISGAAYPLEHEIAAGSARGVPVGGGERGSRWTARPTLLEIGQMPLR